MADEGLKEVRRRSRLDLVRDDRLVGVDMRTRSGRRAREVGRVVEAQFPDADPVRRAELVRLRLLAEQMQADLLAGKRGSSAREVVRMANVIARLERELREVSRGGRDATPSLADILAEHAAQTDGVA